MRTCFVQALIVGSLHLTMCASNLQAGVVGLRSEEGDFFVAARGEVDEGVTVSGIRFFSNDVTIYPLIELALDERSDGLPQPGSAVRSAAQVRATAGYVTVYFTEPFHVPARTAVWAIVKFPDRAVLRRAGMSGGPGIGWRSTISPPGVRSFFSVNGSMNEFEPAFDIDLLFNGTLPPDEANKVAGDADIPNVFDLKLLNQDHNSNVSFQLDLPAQGVLRLNIYSVAGRLVRELANGKISAGRHLVLWDRLDADGDEVARGVYLYRLQYADQMRTGKVVNATRR